MTYARNDWPFRMSRQGLVDACEAKISYHAARLEEWSGELNKATADLRERGVELREHPITGGSRIGAVLDPERAQRVEECRDKVAAHKRELDGYEAFMLGLSSASATSEYDCTVEDIRYFFFGPGTKYDQVDAP